MHSVAHSVTYLPTHLVTRSVASQSRVSRRGRQRISAASKHCYAASRSRRVSPRTVDFAVRTNERTNERPNERTNKRTNERTNERTNDDGGGTTYSRVQYSVAVFGVALLRCCSLLESGGCCSLRCGGAAAALLCCCVVVLLCCWVVAFVCSCVRSFFTTHSSPRTTTCTLLSCWLAGCALCTLCTTARRATARDDVRCLLLLRGWPR